MATLCSVAVLQATQQQLPRQQDSQSSPSQTFGMGNAYSTSEGSRGCKSFELTQRNLKKDLIKISTLTLSSVAVLQAALQLPLQQDSQSKQRSNIGIGIQLQEAAEIQYFGVRELMYQYNIEGEK